MHKCASYMRLPGSAVMYYTFEKIKYYLCKNVLETDRYLTYHDVVGKLVDGPMPKLSNRDIGNYYKILGALYELEVEGTVDCQMTGDRDHPKKWRLIRPLDSKTSPQAPQ